MPSTVRLLTLEQGRIRNACRTRRAPVAIESKLVQSIQNVMDDAAHLVQTVFNQVLVPRPRNFDDRPQKVKFLDTCRALVSEATLAEWLVRQAKVDLSQWGQPGAKTVGDLFTELVRGESQLRSDGCRVVRVAKVRILHGDYELINTLQARRRRVSTRYFRPSTLSYTAARSRFAASGILHLPAQYRLSAPQSPSAAAGARQRRRQGAQHAPRREVRPGRDAGPGARLRAAAPARPAPRPPAAAGRPRPLIRAARIVPPGRAGPAHCPLSAPPVVSRCAMYGGPRE